MHAEDNIAPIISDNI